MSAILARYWDDVGRLAFLLDTIAKATLLLLAATAVTALLRRSSAAVRHWIWCLAFAALVLLPGLSAALPQWRLAVLPGHQLPAPRSELPLGGPLARQAEGALNHQASVPTESDSAGEPLPLAAQAENGSAKQATYMTPLGREPELTTVRLPSLALVWLIGTLLTLLPLLVGLIRTLLLRRQSHPIDDTSWTTLLDELRLRLALGRRVGLYENSSALMPMTWGVLRPIVMLPRHAREWTDHLRRIVLLHELAHVKRCDVGFQLLGRVVCALYWFHPLVWYALRRLRIERELACDDCVVLAGERATDYATNLLQIARDCRPVAFAAAIAMAQRGGLEHRVRAMFDRASSHLPLGARAARLMLLAVLLLVTTVAAVRLAPRAVAVTKDPGDVTVGGEAKANDKPAAQRAVRAGSPPDVSGKRSSARIELRGSVSGPSGRPLAGATVYVRRAVTGASDPPLSSATTDDRGRFQIGFTWPNSDERAGAKPDLVVVADAEGFAADWKYLHKEKSPGEMTLRLSNEQAIEGRIFNSEGKPLAGVELRVEELARYDHETMRLLLDDVAQGRTILRAYKDWRYGPLPRQPADVTTADDGRFRIAGLAADTVVKLRIRGAGVRETIFDASTAVRDAIRGPVPPVDLPDLARGANVLYGSEIEYIAEPSRRIRGVVRDGETGRPVPGAKISCSQETAALGGGLYRIEAETDTNGRYSLDGCGKEPRSIFNVDPPGNGPAYFPAAMVIQDTPGLEPIVRDVDLVKGIELRGRIVDSETGKPLVASVQYAPLYLNTYAAPLYQRQANLRCHARSTTDGSFRIVVAPGPGALAVSHPNAASQEYITVRVSHDDVVKLFEASAKHRELARSPELKRGFPDAVPTQENAGWGLLSQAGNARTVLIGPDEDKPPEPLEVRLVRGRTIRGQVVGPEGKPLTGVTAYLDNPGIGSQLLSTADFQVTALVPEEKRALAFYHEQRKLGAFLTVTADEPEPLTARLEPCGTAVGRLVDTRGAPVEGVHVWFYRGRDYTLTELFSVTDAEGRFHIDQLIPGQSYEVLRSEPGSRNRLQFSRAKVVFTVGSGQTHDLGDLVDNGRN